MFDSDSGATFSECGRYRYLLWRRWGLGHPVNFLMLNPSTADETANDPTVERCVRRAKNWGAGGLIVTNLFALRSTDPKALKKTANPIGPENDEAIVAAAEASASTICAWGAYGTIAGRSTQVRRLIHRRVPLIRLYALKLSSKGEPCHPLYLSYDLKPIQLYEPIGA